MRLACAAALLACGCGRIGFGAQTTGDGATDGAADTSTSDPSCTTFDQTYPGLDGVLGLAWTGTGYAMLTLGGLYNISESGALGSLVALPDPVTAGVAGQALAWNGSELAVTWVMGSGIVVFALYDASLAPIGMPLSLGPGTQPNVIWTGTAFAMAWLNGSDLYLRELDAAGTVVGNLALSGTNPITEVDSMVSTGQHYLIAVSEDPSSTAHLIETDEPLTINDTDSAPGLGASVSINVQLAAVTGGAIIVQAEGGGSGTGEVRMLGATGAAVQAAQPLPMFGLNDLFFATVVPFGNGARMVGEAGTVQVSVVTADIDASTTFSNQMQLAVVPAESFSPPVAAVGPGRVGIAFPYYNDDFTMDAVRMWRQCE